MPQLSEKQAETLSAFIDAFELHVTGVWPVIEAAMREDSGIDDPSEALEDAKLALQR